jgi:indole-3-glycerol phosphate synthase
VLTDEKFFQGRVEYLQLIRDAVRLPILRKDFIIDELQVYESVARGADAILLVVAILDDAQLKSYRALAEHLRLSALVEVHDEAELDRALAAGAEIIGINNRDLRDFSVNLATTESLAGKLRRGMCADRIVVAESGITSQADVERLRKAGVDAILVGESLMRSGNIAAKVKELLG